MKKIGIIERISIVQGALNMLGCVLVSCDGKLNLTSSDITECIEGCAEDVGDALAELREKEDDHATD